MSLYLPTHDMRIHYSLPVVLSFKNIARGGASHNANKLLIKLYYSIKNTVIVLRQYDPLSPRSSFKAKAKYNVQVNSTEHAAQHAWHTRQ